ncbi:hypothetical protein SETIT_8G193400v2 [Setaria italica]|uniref:Secreted protein n=1 Tax=Setaria italica TaxID=4555 RepID=A0A368S9E4_SETIT|nr:hypothetical protein SETIT_8G193400v2 [Setaria italica]
MATSLLLPLMLLTWYLTLGMCIFYTPHNASKELVTMCPLPPLAYLLNLNNICSFQVPSSNNICCFLIFGPSTCCSISLLFLCGCHWHHLSAPTYKFCHVRRQPLLTKNLSFLVAHACTKL